MDQECCFFFFFLGSIFITAALKSSGTKPVSSNAFVNSGREVQTRGRTSINNLVEIGSRRQVADLDEMLVEVIVVVK